MRCIGAWAWEIRRYSIGISVGYFILTTYVWPRNIAVKLIQARKKTIHLLRRYVILLKQLLWHTTVRHYSILQKNYYSAVNNNVF